jgi:hypothetical protein
VSSLSRWQSWVIGSLLGVSIWAIAMTAAHYASSAARMPEAIARMNSRAAAKTIQGRAIAWRFAHPLSCPTLTDLGSADERDAWQNPYVIECTGETAVSSAGPDRRDHTQDDIHYPE